MSQKAQLGPIDVQLLNEEEVGERRSGLAPRQAMDTLSQEAGRTFHRMFRLMRLGGIQLPTRLATETAASMAVGLMGPIYAQIDPIRMGEIERSVSIAKEYGERLRTPNVKKDTIEKLLSGYPSHEFVIDREESEELFEKIEKPIDELEYIAGVVIRTYHPTSDNMDSFVLFLNPEIESHSDDQDGNEENTQGDDSGLEIGSDDSGEGPAVEGGSGDGSSGSGESVGEPLDSRAPASDCSQEE